MIAVQEAAPRPMRRTARAVAPVSAAHDDAPASMQERAYRLLKRMIDDGRVRPGERLLEVQVARAFGVSRSPARHALQALAADRLVRPAPGRGYVVGGPSRGADAGRLANLEEMRLAPAPRWERVYGEVERDVCTHVLYRSLRITEERLAEHFGVSRTVARDVLTRLFAIGLVSKDRAGHWRAERVTPRRIRDLYEMRWLLEPQALVQSAPNVPRTALERIRDALKKALATRAHIDSAVLARIENDLHVELLAQCPNGLLLRTLEHTHLLLVSNQYIFDLYLGIDRKSMQAALREHLAVVDLVLQDDVAGAAALLRDHLQVSCGVWLERFDAVAGRAMPAVPRYLSALAAPAS
jgi:DNA-binding GntR family transcriptional regulator